MKGFHVYLAVMLLFCSCFKENKNPADSNGDPMEIQGIKMVSIPADSFSMGEVYIATPVHSVTLSAFEISAYEITQSQYKTVMGTNPSYFSDGGDNYPVENVSWYDAVRYCNKISNIAGLDSCYNESTWECDFTKDGFRLPTEAEWEYSCRGDKQFKYGTDDGTINADKVNYSSAGTVETGSHPANPYGLYDMSGNVMEWCNDLYGDYSSQSATNPKGAQISQFRLRRGGSW